MGGVGDLGDDERAARAAEHLSLVRALAGQIAKAMPREIAMGDLVAAGTQGLLEALDRYDPSRGVAFATFAYYRIRGAIYDELRRMSVLPRRTVERMRFLERADDLAERAGREGAASLGGEAGARAASEVLRSVAASYVVTAVVTATAATVEEEPTTEPSPESVAEKEAQGRIRSAIDRLPERERTILSLHYFEDLTLLDAGRRMGLSKSWASRLHARALVLLRAQLPDDDGRQRTR